MRRKDREVLDKEKIKSVIERSYCCRMAIADGDAAYIVPLCFGYEEVDGQKLFYFHCAAEGKKINLLKENNVVGFELDTGFKINESQSACGYSAAFTSIIGKGEISFIENAEQKSHALNCIMRHYTRKSEWAYNENALNNTCVLMMKVTELSCKEHL